MSQENTSGMSSPFPSLALIIPGTSVKIWSRRLQEIKSRFVQRKAENRAVVLAGRGNWSLGNVREQRQEIQYNSCSCIFSELVGYGRGGEMLSGELQGSGVLVL